MQLIPVVLPRPVFQQRFAHRLGKTRDWVVIAFHDGFNSSQRTVVTKARGERRGLRVVRGRERGCRTYYQEHAPAPLKPDSAA